MSNTIQGIITENRKLMMEVSGLDLSTSEGQLRKIEIANIMSDNNATLQMFGAVLPDNPRMMNYKLGGYGKKK